MILNSLPVKSFYLIRHGETIANANSIIAGITDVPLSALGRYQAQTLAEHTWPDRIALFSSPLTRAQDTCQLAFPGYDFKIHDGIMERNWGIFEGRNLSELSTREDTPDEGESWPAMLARVHHAISEICVISGSSYPVIVCHSGVIRAVRVLWTSGTVGDRPLNAAPILFHRSAHKIEEKPQ
ncbi:histidine phosphatase family protein [Kiloniella sp. EL199]|uniref:histidine phosphatase family protein n=1 Tax=Kiloniella sp. EL199 TaxID=2107581 RepID=UPI000EA1DEDF|nr:histidine phosphatase family protein [Kiloniella sp. EL199]